MSIWCSVELRDPVFGIANDSDEANYNGRGEETVLVDVATTWHDKARLSVGECEVLLSAEKLRRVAHNLLKAANALDGRGL